MGAEQEMQGHRTHVVKLAYRMLGSTGDAEDIAQEALLRWKIATAEEIRTPRAWLTRTATRLCLDRLKSADRTRMAYVGDELPEPLVAAEDERRELDDTLSVALLATVQRLRPTERAVFLLHDVFDYPFDEVGEMLDLRPENCRQLAVRARRHLHLDEVRSDATPEDVEQLTDAFFAALESGETEGLRAVLAADVVLRSDGGGKVSAAPGPLHGAEAVADFLERVTMIPGPSPVRHRRRVWFNGSPGVVVTDSLGRPQTAFHFLIAGGLIRGIYAQRNPDKLTRLNP